MKKTVMAKSSEDLSSKRHFHWTTKVTNEEEQQAPTLNPSTTAGDKKEDTHEEPKPELAASASSQRRKLQTIAVSRLRSVLTTFRKNRSHSLLSLGPQVVGTLFGHRHGHVHMAFQKDAASEPAFLIELATPISGLVREMVSGLARIALECDKEDGEEAVGRRKLLEEPRWRAYCNGKKCRFAARRECGPREWKVLKVVEPISMGAGVLPGNDGDGDGDGGGEIMYMRAKFERVVGSRDSEAFYMMNPDNNGTPELSIYLLRV